MKKNKSDYELRQGRRMLVLLIIALLVAGFSFYGNVHSFQQSAADKQVVKQLVIWIHEGPDNIGEGIWQFPEKTTLNDLQALPGVQPLTTDPETLIIKPFSTYSLCSNQPDDQNSAIHYKLAPLVFKPLSINNSDIEALTTLDGIGVSLAERIVRLRERIGKFDSPDQLLEIKGIGKKSLESLAGQVSVD